MKSFTIFVQIMHSFWFYQFFKQTKVHEHYKAVLWESFKKIRYETGEIELLYSGEFSFLNLANLKLALPQNWIAVN